MTGRDTRAVWVGAPRSVTDQLYDLRSDLERRRQFRLGQLDELAAESAAFTTMADAPRLQVVTAIRVAAVTALADIEAALMRIEYGTYGTCEECETVISIERLEVLPMSRRCMRCQYRADRQGSSDTGDLTSASQHNVLAADSLHHRDRR